MEKMVNLSTFYKNKKVLVTGHTGFKGSWLILWLKSMGAEVCGYSLNPTTNPSLYEIINGDSLCKSYIGDIADKASLEKAFYDFKPEIVFHLAAQPIVRIGYTNPVETYQTNVMGTVNILECVRNANFVKSVVNVTTDKVYENKEWCWGYREDEPLDGYDPYSNSKSCSELVTHSYKKSYFDNMDVSVSTARAGNVIGGGDFAPDRIIPDCFRAASNNTPIVVRNAYSTRPYQHVLEPLYVYLLIAKMQYENKEFSGYYNVGPDDCDCVETGALVDLYIKHWGEGATRVDKPDNGPHEASFLKLDCSKIKRVFSWKPVWGIDSAIKYTVEWHKAYKDNKNIVEVMKNQIQNFTEGKQ